MIEKKALYEFVHLDAKVNSSGEQIQLLFDESSVEILQYFIKKLEFLLWLQYDVCLL